MVEIKIDLCSNKCWSKSVFEIVIFSMFFHIKNGDKACLRLIIYESGVGQVSRGNYIRSVMIVIVVRKIIINNYAPKKT